MIHQTFQCKKLIPSRVVLLRSKIGRIKHVEILDALQLFDALQLIDALHLADHSHDLTRDLSNQQIEML